MGDREVGGGSFFPGILFLTFMVLKLTEVIDWSWWWVTAPLWGSFVILFVVFGIVEFARSR